MAIEVFAELTCPFTHLALRRIVQRRAEVGRNAPTLRIRPWPLELVNGRPLDAQHVAEEADALRAQVSPDLFSGLDVGAFPASSFPGFRLAEVAYDRGDALGERVSLALRDALFEEGRDIGSPDVVAEIAEAHGLEAPGEAVDDRVRAAYEEGRRRGVEGSPFFFVGDAASFCPLLDIGRDDAGALQVSLDEPAVHALLDGWFAAAGS